MSIRTIIIILLVIALLVLFFRNRGNFKTYELKGKVTMINNCSRNNTDLPDKINIKAKLHYHSTTARADSFNKANIPAAIVNPTTREATYSLNITTSDRAKQWVVEAITSSSFSEICEPIPCPDTTQECENRATGNEYTIDVPSGTTVITEDYRFACQCITVVQPTPRPTAEPTPEPTAEPTEEPQ